MNSKAAAIRVVLKELGNDVPFKGVNVRLNELGVTATPQQVSNERRKLRDPYDVGDLPVSIIKKVKALVDEIGSVGTVRRALDELELLQRTEPD